MTAMVASARSALAGVLFVFILALAVPASAQQPASVNPTASAVSEEQLLNALKPGTAISGRVSIPDSNAASLIKPAGRTWQEFNQGTLQWIGGIAILGMLALLVVFYLGRGKIRIDAGPSGRTITRFNTFERFVHWLTAGSFIVLALSGLNITFGKALLMPVIGADAFAALSQLVKYVHNFLAFPFMLGVALMFLIWVKDNIPTGTDVAWFAAGGGLLTKGSHPPARRFNGGQKMVFWMVVLGGAALSVTGWFLLFPFTAGHTVADQHFYTEIHGIVSMLLIAAMLAHAYIGSIGMEGAFEAMGSGEVDLNWAKEHHSLWVEEELARGVSPVAVPAE
jgi:formate dehydrogenase subunit gamma